MAAQIIAPIIGAFSNAMRGGQFGFIQGPVKVYNAMIFGAMAFLYGHGWISVAMAIGMFIGSKPGWGDYIGAMIGEKVALKEQWYIDVLIKKFISRPKLWGFLGLTLRGLLWGAVISLCSQSPLFLVGGLMGVVYFIAIEIAGRRGDRIKGWPLGEWMFGALLWSVL